MKRKLLQLWLVVLVIVVALTIGAPAWAQEDEPEGTPTVEVIVVTEVPVIEVTESPAVEDPPVVVVEQPTEVPFNWRDAIYGGLFLAAMLMLGFSHPPSAGKIWKDLIKEVQEHAAKTPTTLDDAIVAAVNSQIQPRLDALDAAIAVVVKQGNSDGSVG